MSALEDMLHTADSAQAARDNVIDTVHNRHAWYGIAVMIAIAIAGTVAFYYLYRHNPAIFIDHVFPRAKRGR